MKLSDDELVLLSSALMVATVSARNLAQSRVRRRASSDQITAMQDRIGKLMVVHKKVADEMLWRAQHAAGVEAIRKSATP